MQHFNLKSIELDLISACDFETGMLEDGRAAPVIAQEELLLALDQDDVKGFTRMPVQRLMAPGCGDAVVMVSLRSVVDSA